MDSLCCELHVRDVVSVINVDINSYNVKRVFSINKSIRSHTHLHIGMYKGR